MRTSITLKKLTYNALIAVAATAALACAGASDAGAPNGVEDGAGAANSVERDAVAAEAHGAQTGNADVSCKMAFTMEGWSAIVSRAEGEGVVTCDNGQTAEVDLRITGGGLTFGKTEIDEGTGTFSDVSDISEIFGAYAQAEASAGAVESVSAQALTKGEVSLAITAAGRGWTLGVSGAQFTIEKRSETTATVGAES